MYFAVLKAETGKCIHFVSSLDDLLQQYQCTEGPDQRWFATSFVDCCLPDGPVLLPTADIRAQMLISKSEQPYKTQRTEAVSLVHMSAKQAISPAIYDLRPL